MKKRNRRIILVANLVLVLALGAMFFNHYFDKYILKSILNLFVLPDSVRNVRCCSPIVSTDVMTTCYAELSPLDFDRLLAGYDFSLTRISMTSHKHPALGTVVGNDFLASMEYLVQPEAFVHGGHLLILTNVENNKLIVDLYEE